MASPDSDNNAARAKALQAAFFSVPNHCVPATLGTDGVARHSFEASLKRHAAGDTAAAVLLPFKAQVDGPTVWYACAANAQAARALQEDIRAFLGPSYVKEQSPGRLHDDADSHAMPLLEAAHLQVVRFDSIDTKGDDAVLRRWSLYEDMMRRRPRVASYVASSFHQLRASFDRALLARNEPGARAAMSAMRERFGVSAENRHFLEIRLNAAFERWDAIDQYPLLPQLLQIQLPPETYGDVMEALYRVHVQPYESATSSLDHILEQFRQTIAGRAQPLFSTRKTSRRPAVLKSFLLHELLQTPPQLAVCQRLLSELPEGAFGAVDRLLRETCSRKTAQTDVPSANKALEDEQFDRAWDLYWPLPDSVDVLRGLIACARESADPAKASAVLSRLVACDAPIRAAVEAASATRLANLRAAYREPPLPASLSARFAQMPGEPTERYVERWNEFARSVEPALLLAEDGMVEAAVECLNWQMIEDPQVFERLYPLWHELFVERCDPDPRLVPLYAEMMELLRARDVFQRTDQELLHQTLVAIIETGDDHAYRQAVDMITKIFEIIRSPQAITWALDVCDSLAMRRVRDGDARMRLLTAVIQACRDFSGRLESMQVKQLQLLALEAQIEVPVIGPPPEDTPVNDERYERSYRIAFYSLDEAATRRAVSLLRALHPTWVIDTSAEQVCSDRLKSLARSAQVFVFAWRCSKHAAYYCVKENAAKERLVMARGVGTTSLVAAAVEHLGLQPR